MIISEILILNRPMRNTLTRIGLSGGRLIGNRLIRMCYIFGIQLDTNVTVFLSYIPLISPANVLRDVLPVLEGCFNTFSITVGSRYNAYSQNTRCHLCPPNSSDNREMAHFSHLMIASQLLKCVLIIAYTLNNAVKLNLPLDHK